MSTFALYFSYILLQLLNSAFVLKTKPQTICTVMNLSGDGTMLCVGALSHLREQKRCLSSSVTSSKIGEKVKEKRKRKNPCIEKYSDFRICHKKREW